MLSLKSCALTVLLAMTTAACTSTSGTAVPEDSLAQLKASHATYQDVIAKYGPPSGSQVLPDGQRMITYSQSTVQTDAKSFIPVVGALMGGSGFSSTSASLIFRPDGVLDSYIRSESAHRSGATLSGNTN